MTRTIVISFAVACLSMMILAGAVVANPIWDGVFELMDRPYSLTVPPNGSQWRAVTARGAPGGIGVTVVQALYEDDEAGSGIGVVSLGDLIYGPEAVWRERIVVVGTCRLYRLLETGWIVRAPADYAGTPVCETWTTLQPDDSWGVQHHVDDWAPSGPGAMPKAGDQVLLDGVWATIEWAHLGIDGDFAVPVEATTWGKIKALLGGNR